MTPIQMFCSGEQSVVELCFNLQVELSDKILGSIICLE